MIRDVAQEAMGTTALEWGGNAIDLSPRFRRWKLEEAVRELNPEIPAAHCRHRAALAPPCRRLGLQVKPGHCRGTPPLELFARTVADGLLQHTFITTSPCSASHPAPTSARASGAGSWKKPCANSTRRSPRRTAATARRWPRTAGAWVSR